MSAFFGLGETAASNYSQQNPAVISALCTKCAKANCLSDGAFTVSCAQIASYRVVRVLELKPVEEAKKCFTNEQYLMER